MPHLHDPPSRIQPPIQPAGRFQPRQKSMLPTKHPGNRVTDRR
jgi:hypothetical protein